MARIRKTSRKNCLHPDPAITLSPKSPREPKTIVDTPRRVRLLADAQSTAGKMTRKELVKLHGIAKTTGYRILKEKNARRSE
jgi:DNA invertase Pin-like site-specific DNA recombinase